MGKVTPQERDEARTKLLAMLKPGATVYTILRSRSASGMSRVIDLAIAYPNYQDTYPAKPAELATYRGELDYSAKPKRKLIGHEIRTIGWLAAKAMGDRYNADKGGIVMGGCGMDMGFAAIYQLGQALWPDGTPKPHGTRNGEPDRAGGYALKQTWL